MSGFKVFTFRFDKKIHNNIPLEKDFEEKVSELVKEGWKVVNVVTDFINRYVAFLQK